MRSGHDRPESAVTMTGIRNAAAIAEIYKHYVLTSTISFEEEPATEADIRERIDAVYKAGLPWLVAVVDGELAAYAYATPWRARSAYRFSVESSVYVAHDKPRRGLGRALYGALLEQLRQTDIHTVIGGIAMPNEPSVALHEAMNFKKVAHFNEVGRKFGRWVDVGYWQLEL
jgi:phosphinothricin acetyltransferase